MGPRLVAAATLNPGSAASNRHDLVAPAVGGTVADSGAGAVGVLSLNACVLFAFNQTFARPTGKISCGTGNLTATSRGVARRRPRVELAAAPPWSASS